MITANQLVLHAVGDYILQSDYMASAKTKRWTPAIVHAVVYTLPFLLLTQSWLALLVMCSSHAIIDHLRLARYICYAKNFLAPTETWIKERQTTASGQIIYVPKLEEQWWKPWVRCNKTGYDTDRPPWLSTWLMIIVDNVMHVIINGFAIYYLT